MGELENIKKNLDNQEDSSAKDERELLLTLKELGVKNKDDFLKLTDSLQRVAKKETTSPPAEDTKDKPDSETEKLKELVKAQNARISQLEGLHLKKDFQNDIESIINKNPEKYKILKTLPELQEEATGTFLNWLQRNPDISQTEQDEALEKLLDYFEGKEKEKLLKIKKAENELGGELYAEKLDKPEGEGGEEEPPKEGEESAEPGSGEGKEGESTLKEALSDKEISKLKQRGAHLIQKKKNERDVSTQTPDPQPKKEFKGRPSTNVSASKVESILDKIDSEEKS